MNQLVFTLKSGMPFGEGVQGVRFNPYFFFVACHILYLNALLEFFDNRFLRIGKNSREVYKFVAAPHMSSLVATSGYWEIFKYSI